MEKDCFSFVRKYHQCQEVKGKFAPNWKGPYIIRKILPRGALYLGDIEGNDPKTAVNANAVKRCNPKQPGKKKVQQKGKRNAQKRKVNIACVQETRWAGSKERNADGYKLWYSGVVRSKNEVGILVDRDLRGSVVEVRRVNNRLMFIKLVIGECTLNVVSAYVPQTGLDEEVKRRFWEGLDEIVRSIPLTKRLFIGGDFSGHIGAAAGSYGEVHGDFGLGDSNRGGTSLLDFAKAFELVIANSTFPKREEYLVTF
ncbi:uncharacterized protein [Nicotiana sylvestris]|uniref:uncharacterized protein n=1 Tax=Nicotiana sylvestris TaxID=4096 RepID=UPI00388C8988